MQENKEFYVVIKGEKVVVTEEVYRAYVRPIMKQAKNTLVKRLAGVAVESKTQDLYSMRKSIFCLKTMEKTIYTAGLKVLVVRYGIVMCKTIK